MEDLAFFYKPGLPCTLQILFKKKQILMMVNINTYSFVNIFGKSVLKANLFIKHENNKVFQQCA